VSGTEPAHTGIDVRDQPVQQPATDTAAPQRLDVAPPETARPTDPEAAAVSGAEPAAAALLEAPRPASPRELRIPVAPPSIDVAAAWVWRRPKIRRSRHLRPSAWSRRRRGLRRYQPPPWRPPCNPSPRKARRMRAPATRRKSAR
jgi:hypothetical protein